ncbi:MAG: HD domain-containing protein [Methanomassiliicoccales archaeon]|nr:HD domain-containing protein [Methanomassiliicoccales archaeon]
MEIKQLKKRFIRDLVVGEEIDDLFSIKYKKPPRRYAGGFAFELRISDRTGQMNLKYWGTGDEETIRELYDSLKNGDVIRVRGVVCEYKDVMEIGVNAESDDSISVVQPGFYDIKDFVAISDKDLDQMMSTINSFIKKVENSFLRSLLSTFFSDELFVEQFKHAPASISIHGNWVGGLLEHTLRVTQICEFLSRLYQNLDRDLLITGAVLHDIGKIEEYRIKTSIEETDDGMLRGHLVIGSEMVSRACDSIPDFPENLKIKTCHILLSHHGKPELGSPRTPMFPEAAAVSLADDMDSRIEQYIRAKEEASTDDNWFWSKRLGSVYLR